MATQAPAAADEPDGGSNVQPLSGPSPFAEGCPGRLQDAGAVSASRSDDGGRTWSSSKMPGVDRFAFEPAITVDARGTLSILWSTCATTVPATRSSPPTSGRHAPMTAARPGGRHLAGPFDMRTAANHRLGEYQGIAGLGSGFAAVVTMAGPQAEDGPSDIFLATAGRGGREGGD
jgi:hypothetical protein